jgi:hypothetical protein
MLIVGVPYSTEGIDPHGSARRDALRRNDHLGTEG